MAENMNVRKKTDSHTVAVVTPLVANSFLSELLEGIQTEFMKLEYDMLLYATRVAAKNDFYILERILKEKKVSACIVVSLPMSRDMLSAYKAAGIEVVLVEGHQEGAHLVRVDNTKGAYDGTEYLIRKGKKRVGVILGNPDYVKSQKERLDGYKAALEANKIKYDPRYVWELNNYAYKEGREGLLYMWENYADAVFCFAGDHVAYGIIEEARKQDIRVPVDMPVMGFDDIEMSAAVNLTTIRQPIREMGIAASKFAINALNGHKEIQEAVFTPELIIRETA